jgi:hypothetical protein
MTTEFKQYRRTQIAEMAPWHPGFAMYGVSISKPDLEAGSPKVGDMIARNPKNHDDKWLVAAQYFADNFEPHSSPVNADILRRLRALDDGVSRPVSMIEREVCGKAADIIERFCNAETTCCQGLAPSSECRCEQERLRSFHHAQQMPTPSFRSQVFHAAERSNKRFGQWMPEQWLEIFIGEMVVEPE